MINWKLVLPWILLVVLLTANVLYYVNYKPDPERVFVKDNRADSLAKIVDSLHTSLLDARHDYDSIQQNIKGNIIKIQVKNAEEINNIHTFTIDQRDSMWSTVAP